MGVYFYIKATIKGQIKSYEESGIAAAELNLVAKKYGLDIVFDNEED